MVGNFQMKPCALSSAKGARINCFGLFTGSNKSVVATSENSIKAEFVIEQLERLSFSIKTITVVVFDNARIDTGNRMMERIKYW